MSKEWPLWEVFIRSRNGLAHKHVGSLHAADSTLALQAARDLLTPGHAAMLDQFAAAIDSPGRQAAARLARLGVYRQTRAGTAALLLAAAAGRLR